MDIMRLVDNERERLLEETQTEPAKLVTIAYYRKAVEVFDKCAVRESRWKESLSVKIDRVVLNRFLGPLILAGVLYLLYYLSIGKGYQLTNYTWPLLAAFRNFVAQLLPGEGILFDPTLRTIILSVLDGLFSRHKLCPDICNALQYRCNTRGYWIRAKNGLHHGQGAPPIWSARAVRISHGIGRSRSWWMRCSWYHGHTRD